MADNTIGQNEIGTATSSSYFQVPDNYIYISHLDKGHQFWWLPFYPDTISDSMQSDFQTSQALGRSAPVYTFSNSGPREVQIQLNMHRDFMNDVNMGRSNVILKNGEDYFESLLRALQSIAVPKYNLTNKAVEPPLVGLRISNQVFIKGVVTGGVAITYKKPILYNDKYAAAELSLKVSEVDPYDATSVYKNGSFRGEVSTFLEAGKSWRKKISEAGGIWTP